MGSNFPVTSEDLHAPGGGLPIARYPRGALEFRQQFEEHQDGAEGGGGQTPAVDVGGQLGRGLLLGLARRGEKAAAAKLQEIAQLPIEIAGVDVELGKMAASLKAEHNLPYADCFAAGLA